MLKAILITVGSWVFGSLFMLTNGQYFTHNVVWLGCSLVAAAPWLWQLSRRHGPFRRLFAAAVVASNLALALQLATELPETWRKQHRLDGLATPNPPAVAPADPAAGAS